MSIIKAEHVYHDYVLYTEEEGTQEISHALKDLSFTVEPGMFLAILGHNGSGKSTLAKHLNALLVPTEGTLWITGKNTKDEKETLAIRQSAGMVFQNPDNQIVASIVEEDVGFGLENIGVPTAEIWDRVEKSLKKTGMLAYREHSPNKLSGGQKQRVAIAGIMAMRPKCIILDEPTAMLDPNGRKEVMDAIRELNQKEGITVILITHAMEEAIGADVLFVMDHGRLVMQGTPKEIFSRVEELQAMRLDVPAVTLLAHRLKKEGVDLPDGILTAEELVDAICGE